MPTIPDLRAHDAAAVRASVALVAQVTADDLDRPTPCAAWDLRALLAHMTVQHHGFAAAAEGNGASLAVWQPVPGSDPISGDVKADSKADSKADTEADSEADSEAYTEADTEADSKAYTEAYTVAADRVLAAFAGDVLDRPFDLGEIGVTVPGRVAISFHFIDYVVHSWDVAAALGRPFHLPDDLLRAAVPVADRVPTGERRLLPGASFAPALPTRPDDDPLTHILRVLGRSPDFGK